MDNRNDTFIGSRWFYAICFAWLFVVETLIALFVRDAFIQIGRASRRERV